MKSAQSHWDPVQYERFRDERSKPFFDLLELVRPRPGMRVADLGCGTGELTHHLHHHLQAQETVGIDRSETMLARSWAYAGNGVRFAQEDIAHFAAAGVYDLIFSNAALHWVPGHAALLSRLTQALAEGGQIAIQVPANHNHPAHTVAQEVAREPPFRDALDGFVQKHNVLEPWEYAVVLERLGYREHQVGLKVYGHHLASREEVVEWLKGSLLTAYKARLPEAIYARFVERYRQRLFHVLDDTKPFFYPFQRIFIHAMRAQG
jgi:trans-aconitate 2-methyltransferase